MIKITYNHQNPFAHRFISHMDQQQAAEIMAKTTKQQRQSGSKEQYKYSHRKQLQGQGPLKPQQTKILTQFNNNRDSYHHHDAIMETRFGDVDIGKKKIKSSDLLMTDKREVKDLADGLLSQFATQESSNFQALKEAYVRLWYEKMALDSNYSALQTESNKKDEIISQMRQEMGNRNGQSQQAPTFFNPHTPQHSVSHNKSAHPNASTSTQQQIGNNASHWNSMHPRTNTAVRSNF